MIDCALLVISYRSGDDLAALLSSVPDALEGLSWRAVVVNNDPSDLLHPVTSAHPQVLLVEAGSNLGYAGGINLALAAAPPSRWTIFLNPDLRFEPAALAVMTATAGEEYAVVPAIRDDHTLQPSLRREPSLLGSLGEALLGDHWPSRPARLTEMVRCPDAYRRAGSVEWATGAALLVPTPVVQRVGSWDAGRFFLYSEETDYCRRIRQAGCAIRFEPRAVVVHRGAGSGTSALLHALMQVNRVRYYRKWHGAPATICFAGVVLLHNLLRAHRAQSRAALLALLSARARAALPGGER